MLRVGVGHGSDGTLHLLAGAGLNAVTSANQPSRIGAAGGSGIVRHDGGDAFYHVLQVGLDDRSHGAYRLSGGLARVDRDQRGLSLALGQNGVGTFTISGGAFITRGGVRLGSATTGIGIFGVSGSAATSIGIGAHIVDNDRVNGSWHQHSGSTLELRFDTGGITRILVVNVTGDGGHVTFEPGSLLDVGFAGAPVSGTWTVMEWEGDITGAENLSFAPGVDTRVWSFAIVGKTLQVTAAGRSR